MRLARFKEEGDRPRPGEDGGKDRVLPAWAQEGQCCLMLEEAGEGSSLRAEALGRSTALSEALVSDFRPPEL